MPPATNTRRARPYRQRRQELTRKGLRILPWVLGGMGGLAAFCCGQIVCIPAWLFDGVLLPECPDGDLRQTLDIDASGLRRQGWGSVTVRAWAHYTLDRSDEDHTAPVRRMDAEVVLLDAQGKEYAVERDDEGWSDWEGTLLGTFALPQVPDGDYVLRATVDTSVAEGTVETPLPLYAPARIHVLTDRPLYQPGDTILFRAVALRAGDLLPLESRPGTWRVQDPSGDTLLEERAPTGAWGVVAGSFPLDREAVPGPWTVRWDSAEDSGSVTVQVEPFTVPRFRVDASTDATFYTSGQAPVVRGQVVYSSGAPVPGAALTIDWSASGDWPPPSEWMAGELPTQTASDADGRFVLQLPEIPADLLGQAALAARISAVDAAGDRVEGALGVLLSQDRIAVSAVTELGEGLVEGFNNRVYLRVTTANGMPLRDTPLVVKRAWDPSDQGERATTDADGVAALQVDPGPPVNVVVPAQPVRPPPPKKPVRRVEAQDLASGRDLSLADKLAMDRWTSQLEACARWMDSGSDTVTLGILVDPSGAVSDVSAREEPLPACVARVVRSERLPAGSRRVLQASWEVQAPDLPTVETEVTGAPSTPSDIRDLVRANALDARACLSTDAPSEALPRPLRWSVWKGSKVVATEWMPGRDGSVLPPQAVSCIESTLARMALSEPARETAMGTVRVSVAEAPRLQAGRAQPTTMLGYELSVAALGADGAELGSTTLRMPPGAVPDVRLRASPVIARSGAEVAIELLRGPGFQGELPEKLYMNHAGHASIEAALDEQTRKATFTLPGGEDGWFSVEWGGARALVFVEPDGRLELDLASDKARYAPREVAVLGLRTNSAGRPVPAAVSLFGVDESLGQLAPLPGPDAMEGLVPEVTTPEKAFGTLDGQALAMGRIRGENAAAATVLRVETIPGAPDLNPPVYRSASTTFDPVADLTDRFYQVLAELQDQVRRWEATAPAGEKMHPSTMARLWKDALAAARERGVDTTDAYGRELRLHRLPEDLLALADPRAVVIDGTRLPEDVENWSAWVAEEEP